MPGEGIAASLCSGNNGQNTGVLLERGEGIEPASARWHRAILALELSPPITASSVFPKPTLTVEQVRTLVVTMLNARYACDNAGPTQCFGFGPNCAARAPDRFSGECTDA